MDPAEVRDLILNVKYPVKITGLDIKWTCLKESLASWLVQAHKHNKKPEFEVAPLKHGDSPQFERFRKYDCGINFQSFLDFSLKQSGQWTSYSYKPLKDLSGISSMDMSFCGFPEISDEITVWLGSHGAHTSCHYDSYGRNVVVQAKGQKQWIMFSPDTPNMIPTRVPYEESSVYSERTFFSPKDPTQLRDLAEHAYVVDLMPGDVLIVPPQWWHNVEAVDNSLSFNAWIPIDSDKISRLDEFLVVYQLLNMIPSDISDEQRRLLFNPNVHEGELSASNDLLEALLTDAREDSDTDTATQPSKKRRSAYQTDYVTQDQVDALILKHPAIVHKVPIDSNKFTKIMSQNSTRFCATAEADILATHENSQLATLTTLINSLCAPSTIATARNLLLKSTESAK